MADKPPLKICFLDAARAPEAVRLLKQAFNINERKAWKFVSGAVKYNRDRREAVTFAAITEGRLVGMICGSRPANDNANTVTVMDLAVDENYGGRGIGHQLLEKVETFIGREWLKGKLGHVRLEDFTKRANPDSDFYERVGYVRDENARHIRDPVMIKQLNTQTAPAACIA